MTDKLLSGKHNASILRFLQGQETPQSAYDILDALRDTGLKAPMQVYRALAKLEQAGLAHKLPKSHGWIACHGHHHDDLEKMLILLSCQSCGAVSEIHDTQFQKALTSLSKKSQFDLNSQTIEVDGLCNPCQPKERPAS